MNYKYHVGDIKMTVVALAGQYDEKDGGDVMCSWRSIDRQYHQGTFYLKELT